MDNEQIVTQYEDLDVPDINTGSDLWTPAIRMSDFGGRPIPDVECYCDKFLYAGSVTLLAGAPKAGKSTLLFHLVQAVASGSDFLGAPTRQGNILYASEQSEASFRVQATKVPGFFTNSKAFVVLVERNCTWQQKIGKDRLPMVDPTTGQPSYEMVFFDTWEKQIEFWRELIVRTHAKILVIDTFTSFARLKENANNDPGIIATRLMELKSLFQTRPELSIVILHHLRKPESNPKHRHGQDENDVLGSQSYIAGVDQIVILSEPQSGSPSPLRKLMFKGRFEAESELGIALLKDQYIKSGI
jgi:AAA domain